MTATADSVLAAAATQIGYYRVPGTPTLFGQWYGLPSGQWCAMFVSWSANQAGAGDIIPKHAYCPSGVEWFKARGQWHTGAAGIARGDVVYFDFPGAPDRVSHVALVESVNPDGSVNTIEGNTSGTVNGDQRNGGLCARKRRLAYIAGYGRPAYSTPSRSVRVRIGATLASIALALGIGVGALTSANPGTTPDTQVTSGQLITIPGGTTINPLSPVEPVVPYAVTPAPAPAPATPSTGQSTAPVATHQRLLNALGYALVVDGDNGTKTKAATRDVQRRCGITRDAVWGPVTDRCVHTLIASKVAPSSVVRFGDTGAKVTTLQGKLRAAGYAVTVDGHAGTQTISAVAAVQARCGLTRDKVAGPATIGCIDRLAVAKTVRLTRVLAIGSTGADVKALQERIGAKPDSHFGLATAQRLRIYERAHNLNPDARAGRAVAASLGWTWAG